MKILVTDPISEEGLNILKQEKDVDVDIKLNPPAEELKKIIADYDAWILRSGTKVTKDIIDAAVKLRVIGRAGVGLDNVDSEAATKRGIIVMNTPGGNTISTAEHTMSMMLALSRNIPQADASLRSGRWERKKFTGVELFGKTLGIIGLGRIGREVAKRALSFNMRVVAYDPFLSKERTSKLEIESIDLEELLQISDYITTHTPLTQDTKHLISQTAFKMMKKGVKIVNCARGGIVDEKALYEAIKEGIVSGAALDVFEKEPPNDNCLLKLENVIVTPHLGASTEEAQINVSVEVCRQVVDALVGRCVRNAVNFPCLEPEVFKVIGPYLNLAEKLGLLQAQLLAGRITRVDIKYCGDIINHDLAVLTIAIIKGLLAPILQETVNFVNAPVIAKERRIEIVESKTSEVEDFANLISIDVSTDRGKNSVVGTLFTRNDPRIVKINEFYIDAVPSGYMLVIANIDKPGIVGKIGTFLGDNNINIAGMNFGRQSPGGKAITVLNIDSPLTEEMLSQVKSMPHIHDAKIVKL
ncbi:MAG: phosphoglycerate dehydrogenase [Candidatus Omnitrophota bacterium]